MKEEESHYSSKDFKIRIEIYKRNMILDACMRRTQKKHLVLDFKEQLIYR